MARIEPPEELRFEAAEAPREKRVKAELGLVGRRNKNGPGVKRQGR